MNFANLLPVLIFLFCCSAYEFDIDDEAQNISSYLNRGRRGVIFGAAFFKERPLDIRNSLVKQIYKLKSPGGAGGPSAPVFHPIYAGLRKNVKHRNKTGNEKDTSKDYNYRNTIQILSHTRAYRDGPVGGWFLITTGEAISVGVDLEKFGSKLLVWAVFGGKSETRCFLQQLQGNGHLAVFQCSEDGTYYAFFRIAWDFDNPKDPLYAHDDTGKPRYLEFIPTQKSFDTITTDFNVLTIDETIENFYGTLYQDDKNIVEYASAFHPTLEGLQWWYSDPIRILKDVFCYRWAYRLILENEVGFIHYEPNPTVNDGSYRSYLLKVWVVDPGAVGEKELWDQEYKGQKGKMEISEYNKILTTRFQSLGVVPCLRFAHKSIEVTRDAIWIGDGDIIDPEHPNLFSLLGPHWRFRIKAYLDRIISTLSDIEVTITPRQHSALYGCFIGDVRVFIPIRTFSIIKTRKVGISRIQMAYTSMSPVRKRFILENAQYFTGRRTIYIRSPWILDVNTRVDPVIFPNPCVTQEFGISWDTSIGIVGDHLVKNPLLILTLPTFDEKNTIIHNKYLGLSKAFMIWQEDFVNHFDPDNWRNRIRIYDMAFTPAGLVVLTSESEVYLHPTNLALKGIGFSTRTKKYRLGALVKRRWCANTVTPKNHNMWVPAYSRSQGHIIIIYHIPIEGAAILGASGHSTSCELVRDSTPPGGVKSKGASSGRLSEKQIHADEVEDTRIDAQVEEKLRPQGAAARKRRAAKHVKKEIKEVKEDLEDRKVFWLADGKLLDKEDLHFTQGASEAENVRIGRDNSKFNEHIIFRIEDNFKFIRRSFESNGLSFDSDNLDEIVYTSSKSKILRAAENSNNLFNIHAVEFSAVEKRLLVATGFQSVQFPKDYTVKGKITIIVSSLTAIELPVNLQGIVGSEITFDKIEVGFSGSIIQRDNVEEDYKNVMELINEPQTVPPTGYEYISNPEDYEFVIGTDTLTGKKTTDSTKKLQPSPLSKYVATLHTINTAIPLYIIRLNQINIFASMDGSFAKPILCYIKSPTNTMNYEPNALLPVKEFDTVVTEHGLFSALSRKQQTDQYKQQNQGWVEDKFIPYVDHLDDSKNPGPLPDIETEGVHHLFIGSVLSQEPLRAIQPFLLQDSAFQTVAQDGEILYGTISYRPSSTKGGPFENPPKTTFKNIPFWSLLKGSVAYSAEPSSIKFDDFTSDFDPPISSKESMTIDPVCPFGNFDVDYVLFPYVEAKYKTRLTAEVAYYGDSIPLEADILVEFSEVAGVSVVISSFLTVDYDQTIIRKTIDVETYITPPVLEEIYKAHLSKVGDATLRERIRVFTITVRPTILNLHCEKRDYFQTIQLNIGCVPFLFKMRLIAEALPLRKISVNEKKPSTSENDLTKSFYFDKTALYSPRERIHYSQRKAFGCEETRHKYCKIPLPRGLDIKHNFFGLSFRDVLVPKFEQFLTKHARRVSGNIVMYDLLGSAGITRDPEKENEFGLEPNMTQGDAGCVADDGNWYDMLAKNATFYAKNALSVKTEIYKHYKNCFGTHETVQLPDSVKHSSDLLSPQVLRRRKYWLFNQTNRNALMLKKKRNYIYFVRAVIVNTEFNSFTFCESMDTIFALQVANMAPTRKPVTWEVYLVILILVVLIVFGGYVYFSKVFIWRTELNATHYSRREIQAHEEEEDELTKLAKEKVALTDPFKRLSSKVEQLSQYRKMLDQQRKKIADTATRKHREAKEASFSDDEGRRRSSRRREEKLTKNE